MKDFIDEFERYRIIAEKAMEQVSDDYLNQVVGAGGNSIAVIVRHISGNLISRFADFLTSDGEKPWRDRDSEFEDVMYDRQSVAQMWADGWQVLESELSNLPDDLLHENVYIRGNPLTVHEAL